MFGSKTPPSHPIDPKRMGIFTRYDVPIIFGFILVLSIVELAFSINLFYHFQSRHEWWGNKEKGRVAFLIFSSARTILLACVYVGFHFARRYLRSMFHSIYLIMSTIFWIISGVFIHQLWGYFECGGIGKLQGGINVCHRVKSTEIIAWVIAAISILGTIPVMRSSSSRHKYSMQEKASRKTATSA